jgi:ribonuclease HI
MLSFGKYRNEQIKDVVKKDKKYLEWLNTQPWFTIKFKELHHQTTHLLVQNQKPLEIGSNSFVVYTDGACSHNGSKKAKAGIGVHFSQKNEIKLEDISSRLHIDNPTNNKAELIAIEKALEQCILLNITSKIIIFTDSQYSLKCITLWYPDWVKKNKLENRKNIDILVRIDPMVKKLNVEFQHIRAHTELQDEHSLGNANADRLATECLK